MRYEIVNAAGETVHSTDTIVQAIIWLNNCRAPGDIVVDSNTGLVVRV